MGKRVTAVKKGSIQYGAVYQPIWIQGMEAIQEYREEIETNLTWTENYKYLLKGGGHNAQIGRNFERQGIVGKHCLRTTNEAGEDLIDWAEVNGLAYVNSFNRQRSPGTWFSRIHERWYELDGYFVRASQRHKMGGRVTTVREDTMSDHRPKKMKFVIEEKKCRHQEQERRRRNMKHEALKIENERGVYGENTGGHGNDPKRRGGKQQLHQ